jgi:hypothetical protein
MSASSSSLLGVEMDHVRDAAQVADVEKAVVRRAVVAGEAAAIHAEHDVEILQADIVDDLVEGALEEGGINRAERLVALGRHAGGEEHRVLLGDAHVEIFVGMLRLEEIERGAVRHGAGDGHDLRVHVGQLDHRFGEDLRVGLRPDEVVSTPFSGS